MPRWHSSFEVMREMERAYFLVNYQSTTTYGLSSCSYQQMAMEDPEPWIEIPGHYKDLNTESAEGNGNMNSLEVSLNDKFKRKSV